MPSRNGNRGGRLADTADDRAGDIGVSVCLRPQLDCVDESSNTTTYLSLFGAGWPAQMLMYATDRAPGLFFVGGWPHYSALLRENANGDLSSSTRGFATTDSRRMSSTSRPGRMAGSPRFVF